jgi:serine/threonine protein kinase
LAFARYRIVRLIGEGGMGAVYEAEQDHPSRTVALKIIKPGLSSPKLLRRFEQESEALGRLQHPGIAHIYEAGTADTGFGPQPYFAMELIRGRTLTDYAATSLLTPRARLEMVARIAEAAHHAHQRGLIHRDLKPGNILVDETGQPKILDFGVARTTDGDTQATSQTDVGQLLGTLAYMSPEQALGDPLEIDIRSDVYALGVILYELLAGRLPYPIGRLPEAIRAVREEEPARLGSLNRSYRGDVETLVATALEKEKSRRYGSAGELAADIRRYLRDEPIVARSASLGYQLQKFARRNRALVTGVAAVFVIVVAALAVATLMAMLKRSEGKLEAAEINSDNHNKRATIAEQRLNDAELRLEDLEQRRKDLEQRRKDVEKRLADLAVKEEKAKKEVARQQGLVQVWQSQSDRENERAAAAERGREEVEQRLAVLATDEERLKKEIARLQGLIEAAIAARDRADTERRLAEREREEALLQIGPTLLTPLLNQQIPQATSSPQCRVGFRIDFDWDDVPGATRYRLVVSRLVDATKPIVDVYVGVSEYRYVSCDLFVKDQSLSGWIWQVQALVNGRGGGFSSRTFAFLPCRSPNGRRCTGRP